MVDAAPLAGRIQIRAQWHGFSIFLAETPEERELAYRIRHDVFLEELRGEPRCERRECDHFDQRYDQLVVTVAATGEPVGTSRLTTSLTTSDFYSGTEFHLDRFLAMPGVKMEMGRVCLCRPWRRNISLAALARGLGMYARMSGADWVFGCSSIATTDLALAATLQSHFRDLGACRARVAVTPRPGFAIPGFAQALSQAAPVSGAPGMLDSLIPPLLKLYLKSGAWIGAEPALDRDFGCVDFFTVLSVADHNASVLGRYFRC